MNITLRLIGLIGIVLFGFLFSSTFALPEMIEESAKGFIKLQIEQEVHEKSSALRLSTIAHTAADMASRLGLEKQGIRHSLDSNLPDKIASVIVSMCGYDCEKKQAVAKSIASGYLERIKKIETAQGTLENLIKGKYIEIVGNLKFDLRIFLGSNFLMFLILLAVSLLKPKAVTHLFLPGMLLMTATVISCSIYIFGQDWFYTILYNDYMGFGYLA